jgi:hypothetical protein
MIQYMTIFDGNFAIGIVIAENVTITIKIVTMLCTIHDDTKKNCNVLSVLFRIVTSCIVNNIAREFDLQMLESG